MAKGAQAADTYEQAVRAARLQAMVDSHEPENFDPMFRPKPGEIRRFVSVSTRNEGRTKAFEYHYSLDDALQALQAGAGMWYPDSVVDLDTGTEYSVALCMTATPSGATFDHDLDTESSASRQHFIDTGRYLTLAERAEQNRQAKAEYRARLEAARPAYEQVVAIADDMGLKVRRSSMGARVVLTQHDGEHDPLDEFVSRWQQHDGFDPENMSIAVPLARFIDLWRTGELL